MFDRLELRNEATVHSSEARASGTDGSFRKRDLTSEERWLPVVGFEAYEVSDLGRVRRGARVIKDRPHPRGYRIVDVSRDGKAISKTVHGLVATAFHGAGAGRQVNHRDGDKTANRADNLEWVSAKANTEHAIATGLRGAARPVNPLSLAVAIAKAAGCGS